MPPQRSRLWLGRLLTTWVVLTVVQAVIAWAF